MELRAKEKHDIASQLARRAHAAVFMASIDKRVAEKCGDEAKMKAALLTMDKAEREAKYYEEILAEYPEPTAEETKE